MPPSVIRFSHHMLDKLVKEFSKMGVTENMVREVVSDPEEVLYDSMTGRFVAYKIEGNLAVIYERKGEDIFIITAIYSNKLGNMVQKRKRSGRWI